MLDTLSSLPPLTSNEYTLDMGPERLGWLEPVSAEERHDREALWQRLHRDGYLYLKGILNIEQIQAFRDYYFRSLASTSLLTPGTAPVDGIAGPGPVDWRRLKGILFDDIVPGQRYEALCTSPEIVGFYEWFLQGKVFLHKRKIIRHLPPGYNNATGAHYDLVYLRGGTDKLYTSWIPLGDCPIERGGLIYLEGSHAYFAQLDKEASKKTIASWLTKDVTALADKLNARWLIANYEAGDMVVHTPYMVHAALNNVSPDGTMRLSTDIRYQLEGDPIDTRWQNHWRDDDGL